MLDEKALRKPEYDDGISVVLTDGQPWVFPRPVVRTRFAAHNDLGFEIVVRAKGVPTYNDLYDRWAQSTTRGEEIKAEFLLARALLMANYSITDEQFADLVQFPLNADDDDADPEGFRIREQIIAVIRGDTPKPSAVGAGPSPTPAAV